MSPLAVNNSRENQPNIFNLLQSEILQVNQLISAQTDSPISLVELSSQNLIKSGGKRIRPMLTLASSKLLGEISSHTIHLAAAVEMIHNATLMHDDVIDHADFRRGKPTSNAIWGNTASVLVGDYLFAKAFELMVHSNNMEVLSTLAQASSMIAQGEVHQLTAKHNIKLSFEEYISIIGAKTASLFAASTEIGALIAPCNEQQRIASRDFGYNLGIAFQMIDDMLDYRLDLDLGKSCGNDLREGKITLPVIIAMKLGVETTFWKEALSQNMDENQHQSYLNKAYKILNNSQVFSICQQHVDYYSQKAISHLEELPNNYTQIALIEFVHHQQNRLQ